MADIIDLDKVNGLNAVDIHWFTPFIIYRLRPLSKESRVTIEVTLQNIGHSSPSKRELILSWGEGNDNIAVPPIQDHIITEWAACGIACIVVPLYTGLRILNVSQVGDSFDYWVGNDTHEFGLEVSGTVRSNLDKRHRTKTNQLLESSHNVSGYVCVTGFEEKRIILSYHQV